MTMKRRKPLAPCWKEGCSTPHYGRRWCDEHYGWDRFWDKVEVGHPLGCWEWKASKHVAGYGTFKPAGSRTPVYAHRWAYEALIGDIPEGLCADHLCRNRACVNPDHIDIVTLGENNLRGESAPARNARATTCSRGHAFTEDNIYWRPDRVGRQCRTCIRLRTQKGAAA